VELTICGTVQLAAAAEPLNRVFGVTSQVAETVEHLAIARLKQFVYDRRLLRQGRLAAKPGTRGNRGPKDPTLWDARAVRCIDFERAFAQLKPEHQQLLWLRFGDGESMACCAAVIGTSPRTASYTVHNAAGNLGRILDELDLL
jgi:DNA-directed RNA polymerase specialized sigma24 family protein